VASWKRNQSFRAFEFSWLLTFETGDAVEADKLWLSRLAIESPDSKR
jgi:hypothetical protein